MSPEASQSAALRRLAVAAARSFWRRAVWRGAVWPRSVSTSVFVATIFACAAAAPTGNASDSADAWPSAEARAHAAMHADPPDWAAARAAFLEAAESGSPTAKSHLGWMYEEGHGVSVDGERAAHWYARAARAGAHDFAVKLGWMYLSGDAVARDRERAEYWFEFAIDADHAPARTAWASVLIGDAQGGRYTERLPEAHDLLVAALEQGHMVASYFLARLYIEGIGGHPTDAQRAAHYTRIGAEHGDARMQGWLAQMYLTGDGVEHDPVQAAMWSNLAAAGGDPTGNRLRVALEAELKPEQARQARQRAVDWALAHR